MLSVYQLGWVRLSPVVGVGDDRAETSYRKRLKMQADDAQVVTRAATVSSYMFYEVTVNTLLVQWKSRCLTLDVFAETEMFR